MLWQMQFMLFALNLYEYLRDEGKKEVDAIKWEDVGLKVRRIYEEVIKQYNR